jgi:signal transduction histidine kinase
VKELLFTYSYLILEGIYNKYMARHLHEDNVLLNSMRDGVISVNVQHEITFVNQSALGLLGYTRSILIGALFEDAVHLQINGNAVDKATSPITKAHLKKGIYTSDSEPASRLTMARNDRSLIPVEISVIPYEDKKGFSIIFHDGTADEKIDQAKSEFIALVSHQLRTPVNIISWYIEKLLSEKKGSLSNDQKDYLTEVAISNKRVIDLVQAIVNVSRTDLSRLKHKHELIDIKQLLQKTLLSVEELATQRSVTLDQEIEPGEYTLPDSDQELASFILKSVLINAVKYTRHGGIVKVRLCQVYASQLLSENDNYIAQKDGVLVSVEDNGIGIPDEEKDRIFSKLYRASNVQALDVTGVGLGLYIAHSFITVLGGKIWFTSDLRKGSSFYIYYPCEQIGIL